MVRELFSLEICQVFLVFVILHFWFENVELFWTLKSSRSTWSVSSCISSFSLPVERVKREREKRERVCRKSRNMRMSVSENQLKQCTYNVPVRSFCILHEHEYNHNLATASGYWNDKRILPRTLAPLYYNILLISQTPIIQSTMWLVHRRCITAEANTE